jgi:chemotaxis response regulator CheB
VHFRSNAIPEFAFEASQMQQGLSRVKRDIIIIGASAGGVEALSVLVSTLPYDIPAQSS